MRIFCTLRISWNRVSDFLSTVFHFGTENKADQLKKPPCIYNVSNVVNQNLLDCDPAESVEDTGEKGDEKNHLSKYLRCVAGRYFANISKQCYPQPHLPQPRVLWPLPCWTPWCPLGEDLATKCPLDGPWRPGGSLVWSQTSSLTRRMCPRRWCRARWCRRRAALQRVYSPPPPFILSGF